MLATAWRRRFPSSSESVALYTAGRFKSPFHDFLRRAAHTAGERRFEQLLPVT